MVWHPVGVLDVVSIEWLSVAVFAVALLYSSAGHAGASGYIAVMSLWGMAPGTIKPIALVLNILVATVTAWQFRRAGHFSWKLFWPFAVLAVPCAFVGGYLDLPVALFKVLVGATLLWSAARLVWNPPTDEAVREPDLRIAMGLGAVIGLLSGLTGTGGGIFLSPLLLFRGWARATTASAVAAAFILLNSIAGLAGNLAATAQLPSFAFPLAASAAVGGIAGSYLGSRQLPLSVIKRCLAAILTIAGFKLLLLR